MGKTIKLANDVYLDGNSIKIKKLTQNEFIQSLGDGFTINDFHVFALGRLIFGTIVLSYNNDIVNSNIYPLVVKSPYKPESAYYTYCGISSGQWQEHNIGYLYIGRGDWVLQNMAGTTGKRTATLTFCYMSSV